MDSGVRDAGGLKEISPKTSKGRWGGLPWAALQLATCEHVVSGWTLRGCYRSYRIRWRPSTQRSRKTPQTSDTGAEAGSRSRRPDGTMAILSSCGRYVASWSTSGFGFVSRQMKQRWLIRIKALSRSVKANLISIFAQRRSRPSTRNFADRFRPHSNLSVTTEFLRAIPTSREHRSRAPRSCAVRAALRPPRSPILRRARSSPDRTGSP